MRAKRTGKPRRLMVEALEDRTAPALLTQMLKDINTNTMPSVDTSSTSASWVAVGNTVYFPVEDRYGYGYEL